MTSNWINRGWATMQPQERTLPVDGRQGGEPSSSERHHREAIHREAMASNTSSQGADDRPHLGQPKEATKGPTKQTAGAPAAAVRELQWDDGAWGHDHDEAAGHHARRLLSRSSIGFHRLGDQVAALRRWLVGERWVRRLAIVTAALIVIFAGCF